MEQIFFQSIQTLEGGTEPSVSNILGNYFPRMNLGLPIPDPHRKVEGYDKLHRSDTTVVLDLLVANGTDVKRTSQETVGIFKAIA